MVGSLTLVDICTAMFTWYELDIRRPSPNAHVRRWFAAIAAGPAFQQHVIGLS